MSVKLRPFCPTTANQGDVFAKVWKLALFWGDLVINQIWHTYQMLTICRYMILLLSSCANFYQNKSDIQIDLWFQPFSLQIKSLSEARSYFWMLNPAWPFTFEFPPKYSYNWWFLNFWTTNSSSLPAFQAWLSWHSAVFDQKTHPSNLVFCQTFSN